MALPKLFTRIFWHNNTTPAVNEDNLNAMSKALDDIDNRVIELGDDILEDLPVIIEALDDLDEAINTVAGYASTAQTAATTATNKAGEASASATAASNKADEAAGSALTASNKANAAAGSATTAGNQADAAANSATSSANQALKSEGYAVGEQNGTEVTSGSPYFQNNSKYFADEAAQSASDAADSATEAGAWSAHPPYIGANGNWYVWNINDSQYEDSGIDASITITVGTIQMLAYGSSPEVSNSGTSTDPIFNFKLPVSSGVKSVVKTGSSGVVDTYRMTFDDNTYIEYTVTNGIDGVSPKITISSVTGGHSVTIKDADHPSGQTFNVMDGVDGVSPEVTITPITGGYRITITDADHPLGQSFDVMNGTGSGDMLASVYDPNDDVVTAGGIPLYVTGAISGKMATDGSNAAETVTLKQLVNGYIDTRTTYSGVIVATEYGSHAEGCVYGSDSSDTDVGVIRAIEKGSHAEGFTWAGGDIGAEGRGSHAEGYGCYDAKITARGEGAHAEGCSYNANITASGDGSHAEGYNYNGTNITASGKGAHAEGTGTTASGDYSHAEGKFNIAGYEAQHVSGKYNSNKSTTLFEVGNGTSTSARSNAFEVHSDGFLSTDNGTNKTKLPVIKTGTIASGSVTFTNMPSSGNNLVEFFTSVAGADYTAISTSGTSVTLTYDTTYNGATAYCVITEVG